jgi:hypothetical protein
MTAVWSAASLLPPVSSGAVVAYHTLFLTVRRVVLGRTLTMHVAGGDLSMTIAEVSVLDPHLLARGQLDVRLSATDIRWGTSEFEHATAALRKIQLRRGTPPVMTAAPVELTLAVPSTTLDGLLRSASSGWSGEIDGDGVARLRLARRPAWGNLAVDAQLDRTDSDVALRLTPRTLSVGRCRWNLPAWTPGRRVALPLLPPELSLTGVQFEPSQVRLHAALPQWSMAVPWRFMEYQPR